MTEMASHRKRSWKICGLRSRKDVRDAMIVGADYVGVVHCPGSPRHLDVADMIALAGFARRGSAVAVLVDPDDALVETLAAAQCWGAFQLHGVESPKRLSQLVERYPGVEMWKAVTVAKATDVRVWRDYGDIARRILFDARVGGGVDVPGGHGRVFDWGLLEGVPLPSGWVLAGGLDVDNVARAVEVTGAPMVDVSSGVEVRAGVKDTRKMRDFADALGSGARTGCVR